MDFATVKKVFIPEGEVKQITRDGAIIWNGGYTNQVPTSLDDAGNIFNGTGYIEGYRLNSSGGLTALSGVVTTGFICCKATDIVRMAGVSWVPNSGYCYISFFDSTFKVLGGYNVQFNGANVASGIVKNSTSVTEENAVYTFHPVFSDGSDIAYIRVNGYGKGSDMIVTINEEITS